MHARTENMASSASLFPSLFIFAIAAFTPFSASSHSAPNSSASTPSDAAENSTLFALLAFKASIVHPSAGKLSSWNTSTHFCAWPGIICTSASNQVTIIDLEDEGLNGTLSPQIANLQELSSLSLGGNTLLGQLPSSLGRLKRLEYLDLSSNQFSGPLPSSYGQLTSLQTLDLKFNSLSGHLPSSLGRLKLLEDLDLSGNQFSGPLPSSYGQLTSLQTLYLASNSLSGHLPSSLGQLELLGYLDLSSNQLSGPLPSSYGQLTSLQTLYLAWNSLSGHLPSSLGRLKLLEDLDLSFNQLSGPLPSSYGQLTSLQILNLASNSLSGHLPSSLGQLELLVYLDLSSNQFSGPLPSSYGQLTSLQTLDLASNSLSGHLPSSLGQLKNLEGLDLSSNQLSGPLPSSYGQLTSLQTLNLASNSLSSHLPSSLGRLKNLEGLDLSSNQLSGPLPSSYGQLKRLGYLRLSSNQFSGSLPSSFGWMTSLQTLEFSQNQMSGPLPLSLGLLANLTILDLSKNQLSKPLPPSLGQLVRLQYLDLSHNQLSGHLPSFIGQMEFLFFLNVSYNQLEGLIPPQIYDKFSSSAFLGNSGLRSPFSFASPPTPLSFTVHNDHTKRNILLVIVFVVGALSLLALFCVWWYCIKSRDLGSNFVAPQYKAWTLEEMRVATNNFDVANAIGSGAVSMCYLGMMRSAKGIRAVALKRLVVDDYDGEDDGARESFVNEFKTICKVRHRNVVKVLGYCLEQGEVALVMEYMEGGDLDRRLHNQLNTLSWEERVNVALDVAEGLVYLHHEYDQPIIHCDIKPKNILLTKDMVAKISDFGIAKLMGVNDNGDMSMSKLRGSFGYMAPEYSMGLRISTKVDVYSFGMLLLELVTGVRPTSSMLENEVMSLRTWVKTLETSAHVRKVFQDHDDATLQEAKELLELGVLCTHDVPKKRPTMYIVRDFILQLKTTRL